MARERPHRGGGDGQQAARTGRGTRGAGGRLCGSSRSDGPELFKFSKSLGSVAGGDIVVFPTPATGDALLVSKNGGIEPKWRGDSKEIAQEISTLQALLKQIVTVKGAGLQWLPEWINRQGVAGRLVTARDLQPVELAQGFGDGRVGLLQEAGRELVQQAADLVADGDEQRGVVDLAGAQVGARR